MKTTTPTNVMYVTPPVILVTDHTTLTVSAVPNQDIYKMDIVLNHHVNPDTTQKTLTDLANHVMLPVLNVLVDLTLAVPLVQKEPTYTTDTVLPLAQPVTMLMKPTTNVKFVTQLVTLVQDSETITVLLVPETYSYTKDNVSNHVQPEPMLTPLPTLVILVIILVLLVSVLVKEIVILVLPQDIYMSIPPTIPSENVLNLAHMDTTEMMPPKLVMFVSILTVLIVPHLPSVLNVFPQCISITDNVFLHVQKTCSEIPPPTLVTLATLLV